MEKKQLKFKTLTILLWSLQIILAAMFFWAGFIKLFTPADQLSKMWPWTAGRPLLVTIAGLVDIMAGIGLTLPRLLRIFPFLMLYACYGIILLMIVASIFHISRGEASQIGINIAVAVMTVVVILLRRHLTRESSK